LPALLVWLLAVLLVAGTFAASRVQAQDKPPVADAAITQRVQSALAKDAVLGGMEIRVATQDGMVSLTGFVRTLEDIAKAGALAQRVRGVTGVRNDLRVANRPSRA
jgi:osmotically-inducible protein OsmY